MTNATIRAHMGAECVKPRLLVEKGVAESGPTSHQVEGGRRCGGGWGDHHFHHESMSSSNFSE